MERGRFPELREDWCWWEEVSTRTPMSTDSDTESVDSGHSLNSAEDWSEISGQDDDIELPVVAGIPPVRPSIRSQRVGFEQMDDWNLQEVFRTRASVMRTVPRFLWASFPAALKVALEEWQVNRTDKLIVKKAVGNCSWHCRVCCCTGLHGVV